MLLVRHPVVHLSVIGKYFTVFNPAFVLMICGVLDTTRMFHRSSVIAAEVGFINLTVNITAERPVKNIQIRNRPVKTSSFMHHFNPAHFCTRSPRQNIAVMK